MVLYSYLTGEKLGYQEISKIFPLGNEVEPKKL
jgi:hypothetical protein